MSSNIEKFATDTPALTTQDGRDPFEAYADAVAPRSIVGKLLRFTKGDYVAGEEGEEIPYGTTFTACVDGLAVGWLHWQDGKPIEQVMDLVGNGQPVARRDTLGDSDREQWPRDDRGEPRDPWQLTNYLPLLSQSDDELYTFTTSSVGGRDEIAALCRAYAKQRRAQPAVHPIIALEGASYQHKIRERGRVKIPILKIVGWEPKQRFQQALIMAGLAPADTVAPGPDKPAKAKQPRAGTPAKATKPKAVKPSADDMSDEITW